VPSPFHLSKIRDLSEPLNRDTVSLQSLICDPMISELWEFNFMHDLAWLLSNMDPDTRDSTRIHVVHGYWKSDSGLELKVGPLTQLYLKSLQINLTLDRNRHPSTQMFSFTVHICPKCLALVGQRPAHVLFMSNI
jgi:hypothetical protein